MGVGNGRLALCAPLLTSVPVPGSGTSLADLAPLVGGWWDASTSSGLLGPNAAPVAAWNTPGTSLADLSSNGHNLSPFFAQSTSGSPQSAPHLCGLLGGAGYPTESAGLLQPSLDPDGGWEAGSFVIGPGSSWTWLVVWSRPNWRQGSGRDADPIALLTVGSTVVLQVDSQSGTNRLVIFPGSQEAVLSTKMARRHTHSIVIGTRPRLGQMFG